MSQNLGRLNVSELAPLLWIVAIALIFWLLILRPAQRRQKEVAQVQAALAPGETVVLTSGIVGTVHETADAHLMLEIAPGVVVKVARGAVGSIIREAQDSEPTVEPTVDPAAGRDDETTDNEER